jgi:hypothetical protein
MFGLQLFLQRKRRMLVRSGAVALVGLTVLGVALPRADAHNARPQTITANDEMSALLSPQPVASRQFAVFYSLPHS